MAVQKKTSAGDRPKQRKDINWTQVGVVAFCVLIAVMCIISFGGIDKLFQQSGAVSSGVIEAGDVADVEYTMYIGDRPLVTSSITIYQEANASELPVTTGNLRIQAGLQAEANESRLIPTGFDIPFKMYPAEFNQISSGIIGLGLDQSRTVQSIGSSLATTITPAEAEEIGIDYANWSVGSMGILNFPEIDADGNETLGIRPTLVTAKTNESMTLQFGYDTIEMTVTAGYRA